MYRTLLYLYILLIPFDNYRLLPISLSSLTAIALGIYFIIRLIQSRFILPIGALRYNTPLLIASGLLIAMTILNIFITQEEILLKFKDMLFIATVVLVLIIFSSTVGYDIKALTKLIKVLLLSVFISTAMGYYEYIHYFLFSTYWQTPILMRLHGEVLFPWMIRMKGTYFDPNYFSIIPFIGLAIAATLKFPRLVRLMLILFFGVAILLTFSRMAFLAMLISILLYIYYTTKRKIFKSIILVVVILSASIGGPFLVVKLTQVNKESTNERVLLLNKGIEKIGKSPVLGYGLGTQIEKNNKVSMEAHNTFIQTAIYGGIPVLILIFFPLFYYLHRIIVIKGSSVLELDRIRLFILTLAPIFLLSLIFLSYLNIKYFWLIYGIITQYAYCEQVLAQPITNNEVQ